MRLVYCLLLILCSHAVFAESVVFCDISKGLDLVNSGSYAPNQIRMILQGCDSVSPNNPQVLLLHGLFARDQQQATKDFVPAINWLEKAFRSAPKNTGIALELASTYELAHQLDKALKLYQQILLLDAANHAALVGQARILRLQGQLNAASAIYEKLLENQPKDIDALNGLGWIYAAHGDLAKANSFFQQSIDVQAQNPEAQTGLQSIKQTQLEKEKVVQSCNVSKAFALLKQNPLPKADIEAVLENCAKNHIETSETQLVHGLLERQLAQSSNNYNQAIIWLEKAVKSAASNDKGPALELALTYERAKQYTRAMAIYDFVLDYDPANRGAILGKARVFALEKKDAQALAIYQQLLQKNPNDVDALNALGRMQMQQKNWQSAKKYFYQSLAIQPLNSDAVVSLYQIKAAERAPMKPPAATLAQATNQADAIQSYCQADQGLMLLNRPQPPLQEIYAIVKRCDANRPNYTSNLMLHGLLERYLAQKYSHNYKQAIGWLKLAAASAEVGNKAPIYELASTYEWAHKPRKALALYQTLLYYNHEDTNALLGEARVLRTLYRLKPSMELYRKILHKNPDNIEALNGLGEDYLTDYQFDKARNTFNQALSKNPDNSQTLNDLTLLDKATSHILGLTGSYYTVPPKTSEGMNVYYFQNLNATDAFTLYAMHNTKQIESGFGLGPTLLPNNSLLLGYQHSVPRQFGWQASYDARQHNDLPFEHRIYGAANLFLTYNLELFGAMRFIFPMPWNTQLYVSGLTAYTDLPFNITVTGFWANQQIGGKSSSYALDFSKEYSNRFFYDLGTSYLINPISWEMHGRVIIPTFKNQAFVAECSHYFFNNSTFATAGWRFYWA